MPLTGQLALALALLVALLQMFSPLSSRLSTSTRTAASSLFLCLTVSFSALIISYIDSDFSVAVVAINSQLHMPIFYKIAAAWGNHEGSMLLWVWVLSLFGFLLANVNFADKKLQQLTLAVQGFVAAGFLLFIIFTSNPFMRIYPVPLNGQELNPLLQDIGLTLHPPMLYLGYVGFSIVYALAIAALIQGKLDSAWARIARPWIMVTWGFLTFGIALGSWWAYRELGWGGWWFWDPVENASLLPWLSGTALLHANLVLLKRNNLRHWVLLLSILTFSLSLLGTFLVRSGVLTSVHSFASDPLRGLFILAYLIVVCGGGFLLFALRAPSIAAPADSRFLSREGLITLNNLFLLCACGTVALGTLYPLISQLLGTSLVSIGPVYFNSTFLPLVMPLLALAAIAPFLAWKKASWSQLKTIPTYTLLAAFGCTLVLALSLSPRNAMALTGLMLGLWLVMANLGYFWLRLRQLEKQSFSKALRALPLPVWGMIMAHMGVGILALGIAAEVGWKKEVQPLIAPGQSVSVDGFDIHYTDGGVHKERNYRTHVAKLEIQYQGKNYTLSPEARYYPRRDAKTSEVDYYSTPLYDLYTVASEPDSQGRISARLYYLPLMNFIWAGAGLIGCGGLLCAWGTRRNNG